MVIGLYINSYHPRVLLKSNGGVMKVGLSHLGNADSEKFVQA